MRHLGLMLAISKPDQPYAGLDAVRVACNGASLAEFVWTLFEAWWAAEAPSKEAWCFEALGAVNDDSTAHRLGARDAHGQGRREEPRSRRVRHAGRLRQRPGADAPQRPGRTLQGGVVRNRAPRQDRHGGAGAWSRAIELADRLVPTLGLDESRTLDFGPRQFEIGSTKRSRHRRDADGARLKELPKPRRDDDAAMAEPPSCAGSS